MSTKNPNPPKTHVCLDGATRPTAQIPTLDPSFNLVLETTLTHGHGIASKSGKLYPAGTVELQYPFFKKLGLDLGHCHCGTLNLSIAPQKYSIHTPTHYFKDVDWYPARGKTENFLFCDCAIKVPAGYVTAYVYLPDILTKIEHFDDPHAIQVVSPFIEGLEDSGLILLYLKSSQCSIKDPSDQQA